MVETSDLATPHTDAAPPKVDVCIVSCGPAGLTLGVHQQLAAIFGAFMQPN